MQHIDLLFKTYTLMYDFNRNSSIIPVDLYIEIGCHI